jgi:hypothetical protein
VSPPGAKIGSTASVERLQALYCNPPLSFWKHTFIYTTQPTRLQYILVAAQIKKYNDQFLFKGFIIQTYSLVRIPPPYKALPDHIIEVFHLIYPTRVHCSVQAFNTKFPSVALYVLAQWILPAQEVLGPSTVNPAHIRGLKS